MHHFDHQLCISCQYASLDISVCWIRLTNFAPVVSIVMDLTAWQIFVNFDGEWDALNCLGCCVLGKITALSTFFHSFFFLNRCHFNAKENILLLYNHVLVVWRFTGYQKMQDSRRFSVRRNCHNMMQTMLLYYYNKKSIQCSIYNNVI